MEQNKCIKSCSHPPLVLIAVLPHWSMQIKADYEQTPVSASPASPPVHTCLSVLLFFTHKALLLIFRAAIWPQQGAMDKWKNSALMTVNGEIIQMKGNYPNSTHHLYPSVSLCAHLPSTQAIHQIHSSIPPLFLFFLFFLIMFSCLHHPNALL